MHQAINLYQSWVSSVLPSEEERLNLQDDQHTYGVPSKHVGFINLRDDFEKVLWTDRNYKQSLGSDTIVKAFGFEDVNLPDGYEHLQEAINMIIRDQEESNPLFKHAQMRLTFRQNITDSKPLRRVHIDPPRTVNSVKDDDVYFLSNKQGTLTQAQHIINPKQSLNRMKPEMMTELGLMQQAEPFELIKGTENTYHVQGAETYEQGRTFIRMIVTHPDIEYFRALDDSEKHELPDEFLDRHDINPRYEDHSFV